MAVGPRQTAARRLADGVPLFQAQLAGPVEKEKLGLLHPLGPELLWLLRVNPAQRLQPHQLPARVAALPQQPAAPAVLAVPALAAGLGRHLVAGGIDLPALHDRPLIIKTDSP